LRARGRPSSPLGDVRLLAMTIRSAPWQGSASWCLSCERFGTAGLKTCPPLRHCEATCRLRHGNEAICKPAAWPAGVGFGFAFSLSPEGLAEVTPFRIEAVDEVDFVLSRTALDLLLAPDGVTDGAEFLEVDELARSVPAREDRPDSPLVLGDAATQVGCDAGVQNGVPGVGENVDVPPLHRRSLPDCRGLVQWRSGI